MVKDNEINQQVAMEILQGAGLNVTIANNGQEGVDAAKQDPYDAILMDIQMPVMDGYDATRQIRKWEVGERREEGEKLRSWEGEMKSNTQLPTHNTPIIAMTAHAMTGDEEKSLAAGMNGHVAKPIDPEQLFATLQKWIPPGKRRVHMQNPELSDQRPESVAPLPADEGLPEYLAGFDLTDGLNRLQGNKGLYRKLLINFAKDYSQAANEIRQALDAEDFDQVHSLVHNLKGLAGNLAATALQSAAVNLEKLVKGVPKPTAPANELNLRFSELENTLIQAIESARSLSASARESTPAASAEALAEIPAELSRDIAKRMRDAAEMGDITTLNTLAAEIGEHSDSCKLLGRQIVQMAEEFDLDGIQKLADDLES